ncbi:Gfo/Idh/MocA family protein [Lysinibacillus sp. SGAir0095]|uniref:Gfo/Idh/MocA family protein n=1 Tax=Lysinibacillus sp. SGAir0095 TaxID=2070463 RepID=UPI00143CC19A|nr:Gfo/Idh/MocA family oxidoreductase [Lysinibacillus sp. SGAir0095]
MKKIKIGIMGYSNIAKKSIIPAAINHPDFELCFIGSRSLEKQIEIHEKYNIASGTYEDLLKTDIDAVYVSTPVALHYKYGLQVIDAGKHLLLEKTFTNNYETTLDLLEKGESKKVVVMEALMYQYHPLLSIIKNLLKEGSIGEIKQIEAFFGFPHLDNKDFRYNKVLGGGAILDALVYPLSLVTKLLGNANELMETDLKVHSSIQFNNELDIDENGTLLLENQFTRAVISYGFGLAYRNEYRLWGTEGILTVKRAFSRPENFTNQILLEKNTTQTLIDVPKANHFTFMLYEFSNKIHAKTYKKDSELLFRMKLIDKIYKEGYKL